MGSRSFRYAPLLVFGVAYVLSCLVGALLLLGDYEPFVVLFEYFSGTEAPELTASETRTSLLLLLAAPAALAVGYAAGVLAWDRLESGRPDAGGGEAPRRLPAALFGVLAVVGLFSLVRADAFGRASSWLDYGAWVESRSENFDRLTFLEFVNLYILIPTSAAWVVVAHRPTTRRAALLRWAPVPITLALSLLLFTRKSVVTALLIVIFAWAISAVHARSPHVRRYLLGGLALLAASYAVLVVVPVYADSSRAVDQAAATARQLERQKDAAEIVNVADRRRAVLLYAALSPLTRSSAPALYYPVVFPRTHDYFRLDVGQDIVGIGSMPNDNVVVWNHMNPTHPGGTTTVSYQFVLYSQIRTLGAIVASLVLGLLLALAWRLSQRRAGAGAALFGSMVLLLATYLAIDSLRNSLVVSYGVVWGGLLAAAATALTQGRALQRLAVIPTNQPKRRGSLAASGPPTRRSYGVTKRS